MGLCGYPRPFQALTALHAWPKTTVSGERGRTTKTLKRQPTFRLYSTAGVGGIMLELTTRETAPSKKKTPVLKSKVQNVETVQFATRCEIVRLSNANIAICSKENPCQTQGGGLPHQ